jgi:prepilin-type N-terminal cleavage/methylation domain-containing protein/prepilin-type processing-associated H-X9-DG protein
MKRRPGLIPMIRKAFTLIELIVVMGVMAVLASLLIPALSAARDSAKRAQCANNLHQLGAAEIAYATVNEGLLTPMFFNTQGQNEFWPQAWRAALWTTFGKTYGLGNGKMDVQVVNGVTFTYPQSKMMLCPCQDNTWDIYDPNTGWGPVFYSDYTTDHTTFKGVNQLFLDGHVAWKPGSAFPAVFNNVYGPAGNANFVHWPGNPYCIYW